MIHGNLVAIVANDATVKGGTYYPITVKVGLTAAPSVHAEHDVSPIVHSMGGAGGNCQEFLEMSDKLLSKLSEVQG